MEGVESADWTPQTLPSWRHSIFVGVWWPWPVIIRGSVMAPLEPAVDRVSMFRPRVWWSTIREIVTIERMHEAFRDGVMR